jgi:hypothetical protein
MHIAKKSKYIGSRDYTLSIHLIDGEYFFQNDSWKENWLKEWRTINRDGYISVVDFFTDKDWIPSFRNLAVELIIENNIPVDIFKLIGKSHE